MSVLGDDAITMETNPTFADGPSKSPDELTAPATPRCPIAMRDKHLAENESTLFNTSQALIRFHETWPNEQGNLLAVILFRKRCRLTMAQSSNLPLLTTPTLSGRTWERTAVYLPVGTCKSTLI